MPRVLVFICAPLRRTIEPAVILISPEMPDFPPVRLSTRLINPPVLMLSRSTTSTSIVPEGRMLVPLATPARIRGELLSKSKFCAVIAMLPP